MLRQRARASILLVVVGMIVSGSAAIASVGISPDPVQAKRELDALIAANNATRTSLQQLMEAAQLLLKADSQAANASDGDVIVSATSSRNPACENCLARKRSICGQVAARRTACQLQFGPQIATAQDQAGQSSALAQTAQGLAQDAFTLWSVCAADPSNDCSALWSTYQNMKGTADHESAIAAADAERLQALEKALASCLKAASSACDNINCSQFCN